MFSWVDNNRDLASAVARWPALIGLDTEFLRTNTYYPVPGLYQVAAGDEVYLIDPLQIDEWQPFVQYLTSPGTMQVMHACQEDLELLHHHLGVQPANIFDTQFANAFISEDFSLSYAALVSKLLQIDLPKHETRSNWLQRPLTEEQLRYAVEDVIYLVPLYEMLRSDLHELGREEWFAIDMLGRAFYQATAPTEYYRNIKKAWQLRASQLAALQHLCAWREHTARSENVPRNRVVWDDHLYQFSQFEELTEQHVNRNLPRGVARRYAAQILQIHDAGRTAEPPLPLPKPLTTWEGKLVKQMRDVANLAAQRLAVAPELLSRRRDLEDCVRCFASRNELSDHYSGWRAPLVGDEFLQILLRN